MQQPALEIMSANRIMAISTLRADGWPQTTIVGYANEGFTLYFLIFRTSQKFVNISADNRTSVAIGQQPVSLGEAKAVYADAFAAEIISPEEREHAWRSLVRRHPNLGGRAMPDFSEAALMRAECRHVSIVDYTQGLGHTDELTITAGEIE